MSLEAIVLAVVNAGRPSGLAAVYALLSARQHPQRALAAYVVVGLAWSVTIGTLVVVAFNGVSVQVGEGDLEALVDLLGGVAALGFAAGMSTGRLRPRSRDEAAPDSSRLVRRLRDGSLAVAAGAGVLTHLPGLFYLLGLNAIAEPEPGLVRGAIGVLIFNAIWFSIPLAVLVLSLRQPEATRAALRRFNASVRRYERPLLVAVFLLAGVYFTVRGALELLGS